jgi:hypothetical protein
MDPDPQDRNTNITMLRILLAPISVTVALVMSIPMLMDPMVLSILYVWCQLNKVRTFFLLDSSQYLSKLDFHYIGDTELQRTDADPRQGCGSALI